MNKKLLDKDNKPCVDEDAPANAVAGDGVDLSPGKKAIMKKKPLKRFKEFTRGK